MIFYSDFSEYSVYSPLLHCLFPLAAFASFHSLHLPVSTRYICQFSLDALSTFAALPVSTRRTIYPRRSANLTRCICRPSAVSLP